MHVILKSSPMLSNHSFCTACSLKTVRVGLRVVVCDRVSSKFSFVEGKTSFSLYIQPH